MVGTARTIAITGAAGYLGRRLARALRAKHPGWTLVGHDVVALDAAGSTPFDAFIQHDIREPMAAILAKHGVTDVVHLAWTVTPIHDEARADSVDVEGTMNALHEAVEAKVSFFLHVSSTLAYGAYPDNHVPLTEASPLRGNPAFHYSRNKARVEGLIQVYLAEHPDTISCGIIRPSAFLGPGLRNYIAGVLSGGWRTMWMMPYPDGRTPIQFAHVDDVVAALLLMVEKRLDGVYNATSGDWITVGEIPGILGGKAKQFSFGTLKALLRMQWALHVSQAPPAYLDFVAYPFVATCGKLQAEGYVPKFSTRSALALLAKH